MGGAGSRAKGKATPERRLAVRILREQRTRGARARELLRASEEMSALPERGRGFVTTLVLGVVRTSGALDAQIDAHLRGGSHLEPKVRDALRIAAFELLYLGGEPRVAVSQGVELARLASPRAAGLANAVLRRVADEDVPRMTDARARLQEGHPSVDDLALVGGVPRWLADMLARSLGSQQVRPFVRLLDEPAQVGVVANAARVRPDEVERLLSERGIEARQPGPPGFYLLEGGGRLARSGLVESCQVVPCDLASRLVAHVASPRAGQKVLEVGQGRGTKSILLENEALASGGFCTIEAVDSEAFKVRVASERMSRAGLSEHVHSHALDARELGEGGDGLPDGLRGDFDLVFVDAPCSGTGTMRRHPEIPWSLSRDAVCRGGSLPTLQLELLSAAATRVAPGGMLVYATCSVLREEDEDVVAAFLASGVGRGFEVDSPSRVPGVGVDQGATPEGFLRTPFESLGCDGHFCARLRRTG